PDIIGKPVREVFPELKDIGYFEWLDQVYQTGKTLTNNEVLLKVLDGKGGHKEGYISFMYQPFYNHEGEIEGIFYFGVDVTREVLARKKVEESERQYIDLIENLPAAVYTTDAEGRIRLFNKAAATLFGCEPETGTLEWSRDVRLYDAEGNNMPFSESPMVRTLRNGLGEKGDVEIQVRAADKVSRNVIVYTLQTFSSDQQLTGSINVLIDITERKQSEEELRKLSLVGTRTNNVVVITNTSGTIDWVNDAFCRLLDMRKEDILGKKASDLLYTSNPHYKTTPQDTLVRVMEDPAEMHRTMDMEVEYHSRHSGVLWLELRGQPLLDPAGQITHYFVIGVDVTEKKRSYDKLKKSKNEIKSFARQLNSVLEEERARIAREFHDEFGQLLTGLKMSLSSLKKRTPGENFSEEMINPMLSDVDTIIQQIRNFATDLRPAILDTLGLLPSLEWLVRDFEKKSGIAAVLHLNVSEELQLDKNLSICCFRICQEALTNIARHSGATQVTVEISRGKELILKITDNGKGILTEKINDPLSMGLLGMRERAHLVGGELTISSPSGSLTSVVFSVPLFPSINVL
ncbi:MAG TPA: PAS domain-containing protein, partial [Sphingobacteriaceae bacterium]